MRTMVVSGLSGLLVGISSVVALAQTDRPSVTSDMGHGLAQHYCAGCHAVEPGASAKPPGPPAFQAVADRPGTTRESLRNHLKTTHSTGIIPLSMPNPQLTDDETNKIVSYILSLRRQPAQ